VTFLFLDKQKMTSKYSRYQVADVTSA